MQTCRRWKSLRLLTCCSCRPISPPFVGLSTGPFTKWMYPVPQPVVSPQVCPMPSGKCPIPFVSPSLDWLAWLGLASLASAWLVSSAAATTTATTPEQASTTTAAARSAAAVALYACSGVVAAADETSHAEARLAKPSHVSQSREGLTNGFGYFVIMDLSSGTGHFNHKTTQIR